MTQPYQPFGVHIIAKKVHYTTNHTGKTSPLKVISPVMAVSERVHRPL